MLRIYIEFGVWRDGHCELVEGQDCAFQCLPTSDLIHAYERDVGLRYAVVVEYDEDRDIKLDAKERLQVGHRE